MLELFVLIAILLFFILIGVPVAFSLGITTIIGIIVFLSPAQLSQMANISYTQSTSITLMVAPLFILMSELISNGGLARDIFSVLSRWLKKIPGGLAISNIFACTVFSALCGSSPVTAATMGKISIPQMVNNGYERGFSIGATVAGGTIGILIPPSLSLIVFGIITETSIARLFMAGILPGLLLAVALAAFIFIRVKINPEISNVKDPELNVVDSKTINTSSVKTSFGNDLLLLGPIVILILVVLGTMYTGAVTPTEAGGVGALGAFLILLAMRRLNLKVLSMVLSETTKTTAMLMFLIIFGMCFAFLISALGIPQEISTLLFNISTNQWVILTIVLIFWVIAGCILDPMGLVVITMPIMFPPLVEFGFEPVWIGVISTIAVCIGMMTPPVGLNLFVIKGITNSPFQEVVRGSIPFLMVMVFVLLVLIVFPGIVMFLPNTM